MVEERPALQIPKVSYFEHAEISVFFDLTNLLSQPPHFKGANTSKSYQATAKDNYITVWEILRCYDRSREKKPSFAFSLRLGYV